MQYFNLFIFYTLTWPDLLKIVLSTRIRNFLTHIYRRTRTSRWFGRENEENVSREVVVAGLPPLSRPPPPPHPTTVFKELNSEEIGKNKMHLVFMHWKIRKDDTFLLVFSYQSIDLRPAPLYYLSLLNTL